MFKEGLFKRKKKAVVVEKTPIQKLNDEIKLNTDAINTLERLKPRVSKLITHYKKQLDSYSHVFGGGITLSLLKGINSYPDGFYAFADKLGLNIEPLCSGTYNYNDEKSFTVKVKHK